MRNWISPDGNLLKRQRSVIRIRGDEVHKTHFNDRAADRETGWYEVLPWAAPKLLRREGNTLILQKLETAEELPQWRPVEELAALLHQLEAIDVHHRDVHVKNIVRLPCGKPALIDWETAVHQEAPCSYDLCGPKVSGVPIPRIHAKLREPAQWWGARFSSSIGKAWGADVPAKVD